MAPFIPQNDPKAGYLAQRLEIEDAIARVMDSGWYVLGEEVRAFEAEFAAYVGQPHAVGVASGTDALEIALRACGIGPGDAVFTVSHTAVATVAAIERCGASPVLVEIDPRRYTLDPNRLHDALAALSWPAGTRPQAIIPVHLYGQMADMPALTDLARRHDLRVIEDCAQAHGAALDGQKAGTWGDLAAFSFYPTKNLGAFGDGGMVVTGDDMLASKVRALREYGWNDERVAESTGVNSRLDELQAAILRARLTRLDWDNERRRHLATEYSGQFAEQGFALPEVASRAEHVFHQYVIRSTHRDALREHLQQGRIATGIHYPVPVHQQPAYAGRIACAGELVHTEQAAGEVLSLPMFPQLTPEQIDRVTAGCLEWHQLQTG